MSILGSLIIDLQARTSSFVEGMSGAAKTARTTGAEISGAFSQLGDIASAALTPFGELGSTISETLEKMGGSAGRAIQTFGGLGGAAGLSAGIIAGAGAAILALDAGAIGLAIHTAETAAKLGEMSEKTGVSTRALAGLQLAGRGVGVETEQLAKALEFMNNSAVKAAIAPAGTATAYSRLGIQVKDAAGKMRDSGDIFLDVVGKIATLPQPEQGFLVRQIFGRGGAEILPLINQGVDGIREKLELARQFGLGDPEAIAGARKFKETTEELKDALDGAALKLTKELLPALQYVATRIGEGFQTGAVQAFVDKVADVVKETFTLGYALAHLSDIKLGGNAGAWVSEIAGSVEVGLAKIKQGVVNAAAPPLTPGAVVKRQEQDSAEVQEIWRQTAQKVNEHMGGITWAKYKADVADFRKGLDTGAPKDAFSWADSLLASLKKPKPGGIDLSRDEGDKRVATINKTISALSAQTKAELDLAGAASGSIAAQKLMAAQGEADTVIAKLLAGTDAATGAEKQKLIAIIQRETVAVHALAAEKQVAKDAVGINAELQKETLNFEKHISSLSRLAAAYAQGGAAIADAEIEGKLEGDAQQVQQLQEEFGKLATTTGVSGTALATIEKALAEAKAQLALHREELVKERAEQYDVEISKQANAIKVLTPFLNNLNDAYLLNAAAVLEAKVQVEAHNYALSHPGATAAQIATVTDQFRTQALQAQQASDAQEAGQFTLGKLYDDTVVKLSRVREIIQQSGASTLLVNAAIFDSENRLIHQWDEQAAKVGSFRDRTRSVFNELIVQGREAGAQITRAFATAFDNAEGELAKLLVTGRGNFQQILQSLEISVVKAGIQKSLGALVGGIPGLGNIASLFGGGPQLGTQANPMYMIMLNAETSIGAGQSPDVQGGGIGGPNITGVGGLGKIGLPVGVFQQGLNTMSAAQTVFAGRFGASWTGILGIFRGAIGLMTALFHGHTAAVVASQTAQVGAVTAGQAAQTAAAASGAGARGNIGFAEHLSAIFRHAAGAAAAAFHKVFDALPFPINAVIAPIAAAGAFAGVLAWGALGGKAKKGGLLGEDGPIFAHAGELIIPADLSSGIQEMIKANRQGGNVPSVQNFSPASTAVSGRGDQFQAHLGGIHISAFDQNGVRDAMRKGSTEMIRQMRRAFATGHLNPRRLARI